MDFLDLVIKIVEPAIIILAGYIGIKLKNVVAKYFDDSTKKKVAYTVVNAVEQVYKDIHGDDKLGEAIKMATEILNEKGIDVNATEIRALLESCVKEMNLQNLFLDVPKETVDE